MPRLEGEREFFDCLCEARMVSPTRNKNVIPTGNDNIHAKEPGGVSAFL